MLPNQKEITRDELLEAVAGKLPQGYRFVTLTCLDAGDAFDVIYHFDRDYQLSHLRLRLPKGQTLPSISSMVFSAVIVENEIKDLFGIEVTGMKLDYGGKLLLAEGAPNAPMLKTVPIVPQMPAKGG